MAFVDDYTVWVVGASAEAYTKVIQDVVLPKLEKWEESSGAVFGASKTAFVHYTRRRHNGRVSTQPLTFKGEEISPAGSVKILGVIMDSELRY